VTIVEAIQRAQVRREVVRLPIRDFTGAYEQIRVAWPHAINWCKAERDGIKGIEVIGYRENSDITDWRIFLWLP
jgi:hypothetical protein